MTNLEELLDAADAVLCEREHVRTAAEARLALAVHRYRPDSIGGKDRCSCEAAEDCDECMTSPQALAYLQKLASQNVPS